MTPLPSRATVLCGILLLVVTLTPSLVAAYTRAPDTPTYGAAAPPDDSQPLAFTEPLATPPRSQQQQRTQRQAQQIIQQQQQQFKQQPSRVDTSALPDDEDPDYDLPRDDLPSTKRPPRDHPAGDDWRTKCAQRCDERLMDVTGVGVQAIKTDWAEVRATVEYRRNIKNVTIYQEQGATTPEQDRILAELISTVQREVSKRAAVVVDYLQHDPTIAPHVTKLRTSTLTLEPIYEYINNRMILSGYRATNSITFRIEIPFAGAVVDEIVQRGITRIDGVTFVASPKELNAARQTAISAAVEDAMGQAMSALSGLNKLLPGSKSDLQIIRMDVVGVSRPEPTNTMESSAFRGAAQPMMAKAFVADMAPSPVEGDEKTVTATVTMKIRF